jgi:hypothetical protein
MFAKRFGHCIDYVELQPTIVDMTPIEFETELSGEATLLLPPDVAARLPKSGRATVVLLVQEDAADDEWRRASYEQFMKDDSSDDSVYDSYQ